MKRTRRPALMLCAIIMAPTVFLFSAEKGKTVNLYQNSSALVVENRNLQLKRGKNDIELVDLPVTLDASSVILDFMGTVDTQVYRYDMVSKISILQRYIDQEISLLGENFETISGKLVSVKGNEVILKDRFNGFIIIPDMQRYRFALNGGNTRIITTPTLYLNLNSQESGTVPAVLSYEAGGLNWQCRYQVRLDEKRKTLSLDSWVDISNNSGMDLIDVNVNLIAGDIRRVSSPSAREGLKVMSRAADTYTVNEVTEAPSLSSVSQYYSYALPGEKSLLNRETTRFPFITAKKAEYGEVFTYRGGKRVEYAVEIDNSRRNTLGKALPAGQWQVFSAGSNSLAIVGETSNGYYGEKDKIRLALGSSFDITAKEKKTEYNRKAQNVTRESWEITFTNSGSTARSIEVLRNMSGDWEILDSSFEWEKENASQAKFTVIAAAGKKTVLTYTSEYKY